MNFDKLALLAVKPALDTCGTAVMWTDPYISRRLLDLHLNPDVDAASRKPESIACTIDWILSHVMTTPCDFLDLGCGPGLYTQRLAAAGHRVTGVDFSDNSLAYAMACAISDGLSITYLKKNYLELEFENSFDLAMIIYTDLCVLCPADRDRFLQNVWRALRPGGLFLFDATNTLHLEEKVMAESWEVCLNNGFWREGPYLALSRGYLYPEEKVLLEQSLVMESDGVTESYHFWHHCYEAIEIKEILDAQGFALIETRNDILPPGHCWTGENIHFYAAQKVRRSMQTK
jgi:SAM-dependent methyltransferase